MSFLSCFLILLHLHAILANLLLTRPSDPAFQPRTAITHDYFRAHYPPYAFSSCFMLGLRTVRDPQFPQKQPRCLVRAAFEQDPISAIDAGHPAHTNKGWDVYVHWNGTCRGLFLQWQQGPGYGCQTYGHIARAAQLYLPPTSPQPQFMLVGYPLAKYGFNGGPYLDPYRFPDIASDLVNTEYMDNKSHHTVHLEYPPQQSIMAIVPPSDAAWLASLLTPVHRMDYHASPFIASFSQSISPFFFFLSFFLSFL